MSINSYIWKEKRLTRDRSEKQVEYRMIDMDEEQLQFIYTHCKHSRSRKSRYSSEKHGSYRFFLSDRRPCRQVTADRSSALYI